MKLRVALLLLALALRIEAAQIALPIYIEDNHAGSFYWLAQHLDLEEPCTLLHFDAHSDASAHFDSDRLRTALRRVHSLGERAELLKRWREKGVAQCFDWIEPLMPAPIAEVIWIPRPHLTDEERNELGAHAVRQLDGHLEAAPRAGGSFRSRYRVAGLEELETNFAPVRPAIATIDLDYFAGLQNEERAAAFARVWDFVTRQRNLRAITIAISRPYLTDATECDALLILALRGALSLPTARIDFAFAARVGNDRSLRARAYRKAGAEVPAFDLAQSSPELRALLRANRDRIAGAGDDELPRVRLTVKHHQPSTDNIWRVAASDAAEIELLCEPWDSPIERVAWSVEVPRHMRCNLIDGSDDQFAFARGAPARPQWREIELSASGRMLSLTQLREFFDARTGCGAVRVKARVAGRGWLRETATIELRRFNGTGFRAALTEQFGLPYLFGSGALRDGANTGPETGWGADCANFIAYALRRQGRNVPWSNPRQLRRYLDAIASNVSLGDEPRFSAGELERGLIVHLGSHIAAVMEDQPPLGVLNADDLVAHQLEGAPELIPVGDLLNARGQMRFDLLRVPLGEEPAQLVMGGDVMLGRSVGEAIKAGTNPLAGISDVLAHAEKSMVNLECVISARGRATTKKYSLRAPVEAADILERAGVDLVSVANNHALDFGPSALADEINALRTRGIVAAGQSYTPQTLAMRDGHRVALLALSDVEGQLNFDDFTQAIDTAHNEADTVIAFVHWGEENTPVVTEKQRGLARWLIDHRVDLVVGSHPHCLQPIDFYHGHAIVYSLGNLVFDGAPTLPSWNRGALLEVSLKSRSGVSPALKLIPVELDRRGFPQLASEHELSQR